MNSAAIDEILIARSRPWVDRATTLIEARIADARQHAWNSLTNRVVVAPDGRPTIRAAKRGASARAAGERLKELQAALIGEGNAMRGVLLDARAVFYRDSFKLWAKSLPDIIGEDAIDERARPTGGGAKAARGLPIHGIDLRASIAEVIKSLHRRMLVAITLAGRRGLTDRESAQILDEWADLATERLTREARIAISDADVAIYYAVGQTMIREEFRDVE